MLFALTEDPRYGKKLRLKKKRSAIESMRKVEKTVSHSMFGIEIFLKKKKRKCVTLLIWEEEPKRLTKRMRKIADLIKIIARIFAYMIIFDYFCICK